MQPEDLDPAYLWDMLDAARTVLEMTAKKRFDQYIKNRMLQLAVERSLEIIGEAASNVSPEFREKHPEIPWMRLIAERNVLAHRYGVNGGLKVHSSSGVKVRRPINTRRTLAPSSPPLSSYEEESPAVFAPSVCSSRL